MGAFNRILVSLDGSETSNLALAASLDIARDVGACVRLTHVVDDVTYLGAYDYTPALIEQLRGVAGKVLSDGLAVAKASGIKADTQLIDSPGQHLGQSISDAAQKFNADLVVVGSHGRRGLGRLLLGSGAEQIMRLAPVPVLVVKAKALG